MTPALSLTLLRTQTDDRLVRLASDGHDRAFEAIVERYRRPLARYLRRVLPAPRAEDVLQQTFVNAWSSLSSGADVRDLRGWLYRIARNAATANLKRTGYDYDELHESVHGAGAASHDAERRDVMRETLASVARLPERQREALLAIAVQGRPHAEVAAELGLSDGALRQLVHRARCTLRAGVTAVTPMPLVQSLLGTPAAHEETTRRVAEIVTTAGAGGVAAAVKIGAVAATTVALVAPHVAHIVSAPAHHHGDADARSVTLVAAVHRGGRHHRGAVGTGGHRVTVSAPARAASAPKKHRAAAPRHHGRDHSTRHDEPGPAPTADPSSAPPRAPGPPVPHRPDRNPALVPPAPTHTGSSDDGHGSSTPDPVAPTQPSPHPGAGGPSSTTAIAGPKAPDAPTAPDPGPPPTTTTTSAATPPPPPCHEASCGADHPPGPAAPTTTTTTAAAPPAPPVVCYDNCPAGVTPTPRPPAHDPPTTPTTTTTTTTTPTTATTPSGGDHH